MFSLPVDLRPLAIVQAGGVGGRMDVLTRERAKPALPFAATHRLIDFPLSALQASQITDVWVAVQYQSSTLDSYLAGGRPWDLDRTHGGFRRITPEQGSGSSHDDGFSHGNVDGLYKLRQQIAQFDPGIVIVMSADHVFSEDLRPYIYRHLERRAECTILVSEVSREEASHQIVVGVGTRKLVSAVVDKPPSTTSGTVAVEIFLFDPDVLLHELERLHHELTGSVRDGSDTGLGDFADYLLPALVDRGRVYADHMTGYWKDVGRPEAYLEAHRDLIAGRVDVFDHPERPVLAPAIPGPPAWFGHEAQVARSYVGPGSRVLGSVHDSVIGPNVQVAAGAEVCGSVLLGDCVIAPGARIHTALIDTGVRIGSGASVGAAHRGGPLTSEDVTLVGRDSQIGVGVSLPVGSRLEPGTTA